jgi:hypothetical protein
VREGDPTGAVTWAPVFLTLLADAEVKAKQRNQGLGHLAEAERLAMRTTPRKDPILAQIDRLLRLAISAAAFLVVAIITAAIIGSLWVR